MIFLITACVVGLCFGLRMGHHRLNPMSIFFGIWLAVAISYQLAGDSLYPLTDVSLSFILPGLFATGTGIFFGMHQVSTRTHSRPSSVRGHLKYDEDRFRKSYSILCLMLFAYVALQIAKVWPTLARSGGIQGILFGSDGLRFRQGYLSDRSLETQGGFSDGGFSIALLGYVLFVGAVALILAGYLAATGRWLSAMLPLLLMAAYGLILLERSTFLYAVSIFLFSFVYHRRLVSRTSSTSRAHDKVALGILVGLVATVAVVPAALRAMGAVSDRNGQGSVVSYLYAGLAGLNGASFASDDFSAAHTGAASPLYFDRPEAVLDLQNGHGVWTFQGVYGIIERLGFSFEVPPGFSYVRTGPQDGSISNVYTFLIYPYYDWGFTGMLVFCLCLGFVAARADLRASRLGSASALALACIFMSTLLMSFFGLALIRDFRYLFLGLAAVVILRSLRAAEGQSVYPPRELLGTA
ncbi:O-antigen polymerase [Terrabacter sp. 2YAF2]|uniref:O-antigen polymerase n=1 Tax=Terrabacter sp. 2YAF2 TaxID=3233026 RepID=UPI003F9E08FC